jgi:hypothetical protein
MWERLGITNAQMLDAYMHGLVSGCGWIEHRPPPPKGPTPPPANLPE